MEVIVCASAKGGVLKTSLATTLAELLAMKGNHRTLLIDLDFQGNSTSVRNGNTSRTIHDVLTGKMPIRSAIQESSYGYLIAGDRSLASLEYDLTGKGKATKLRDALKKIEKDFDYVVIDTTPQLNLATINALAAADKVIIPTQGDAFSLDGIEDIYQTVESLKAVNPNVEILGILRTRFNERTNLNRYITEQLKEMAQRMGTKVFETYIRENTRAKEAQVMKQSIFDYDPKSHAAKDYLALYRELGFKESEED